VLRLKLLCILAVISAVEYQLSVPAHAQLVGKWPFNEQYGIVVNDISTGGSDGAISNHFIRECPDTNCYLALDGSDGFVDFGTKSLFDFYDAFSLEAWVYARGPASGEAFIIGKAFAAYGLTYYSNGRIYFYGGYSGSNNVSYLMPLNQWVHIVGTVDNRVASGYNMFLYVNGTRVGYKRSANRPVLLPYTPLICGVNYEKTSFLAIDVDEIRVYNHAMTQQEINASYLAGTTKQQPPGCDELATQGSGVAGDLNYDCKVDMIDIAIFARMWAIESD